MSVSLFHAQQKKNLSAGQSTHYTYQSDVCGKTRKSGLQLAVHHKETVIHASSVILLGFLGLSGGSNGCRSAI